MEETKMCCTCRKIKSVCEFFRNTQRCKACKRIVDRKSYHRRCEVQVTKVTAYQKARIEVNQRYIISYLAEHPCTVCGEARIPCLEFHHVNPAEKLFTIGAYQGAPLTTLRTEIAKCVVLCANCHKMHHNEERGWFKTRL
jgi:hypothetical protein